jgi:hypothetical protein
MHPTGVLMADGVGEFGVHCLVPLALHDVEVGTAHSGAADLDDHIERSGDRRLRDLLDHRVPVVLMQTDGSHLLLLLT